MVVVCFFVLRFLLGLRSIVGLKELYRLYMLLSLSFIAKKVTKEARAADPIP